MTLSAGVIVLALTVQTAAAPPAHRRLTRTGSSRQGACARLLDQKPTPTVSPASSLESGRYRSDTAPIAVYSGQMRVPAGAVPIEIELHAGGAGILRPEGLRLLVLANAATSADALEVLTRMKR